MLQTVAGQTSLQLDRLPEVSSDPPRPKQADQEIKCRLDTSKPTLDFEFRLLTSYRIEIPMKQLVGPPAVFNMSVRITPTFPERTPLFRDQTFRLQAVPKGMNGVAEFAGSFVVGEGVYEVHWSLYDNRGRFCEKRWEVKAKLRGEQRKIKLTLDPGEVAPAISYLFREEPPSTRRNSEGLRIKAFVNFDLRSRYQRRKRVRPWEFAPLVSTLRLLSRHPSTTEFSVVVYSVEEQKVLFRHGLREQIDFPAFGRALGKISPFTVDASTLRKGSDLAFFHRLLEAEMLGSDELDAFVFIGANTPVGRKLDGDTVRALNPENRPVFFLNSGNHPWGGLPGKTVGALGGKKFRARRPRQVSKAVNKLIAMVLERKGLLERGR